MNQIANKTFCITGKLENFEAKREAFDEIMRRGGNAADTLTAQCDYLILGARGNANYAYGNKGTKQQTAEEWARQGRPIKIVSENQFLAMLEATEEVSWTERGKILDGGGTRPAEPIACEEIGGLKCSEWYWKATAGLRQVLRVRYESGALSNAIAENHRGTLQQLKQAATARGLRSSVRTEIYPAGWAFVLDSDGLCYGRPDDEEVVLSLCAVVFLESDAAKVVGRTTAQQVKDYLVAAGIGGRLDLRIWDEASRYAQYWIRKLRWGS
jgi:hypothetical protein